MLDILILPKNIQKEFKKTDKKVAEKLNYDGIEFPVQEKDFSKNEAKNNICINVFGYENGLAFPIYISDQKFEPSIDLLLLIDDDKSHYVYIKDFDRFMFHKTKNKTKIGFVKVVYSVLLVKVCYEGSYTKYTKITFLVVLLIKLFHDRFTKRIVVHRGEFIKAILKEYKYCRKIMRKHFNKKLIMSKKEEHLFQESKSCWICEKLFDNDEEKVRDHCHVVGNFRGATHWDCNINFQYDMILWQSFNF